MENQQILSFQDQAILILRAELKELEEMATTTMVAYTNRQEWIALLPTASNIETLRILTESQFDLVV